MSCGYKSQVLRSSKPTVHPRRAVMACSVYCPRANGNARGKGSRCPEHIQVVNWDPVPLHKIMAGVKSLQLQEPMANTVVV